MKNLELKSLRVVESIFILTIIILLIVNLVFYRTIIHKFQANVKSNAADAVKVIDGDKLTKVIKNKAMNSTEYKEIQIEMIKWKNDKDVKYFYTMYRERDTIHFLIDSALVKPEPLGQKYNFEEEMRQAFDGKVTYTPHPVGDNLGTFVSAYAPIKNSHGEVIAIVGVDVDFGVFNYMKYKFIIDIIIITFMIAVAVVILRKLEETSMKHKILFENAHDIILYTTENGQIIDGNKTAVMEYGYSYNELKTKNLKNLRTLDSSKNLGDIDSEGSVFETINIRKDGTTFPAEISTNSIIVNNERIIIRIIRNITERKKIEEKVVYLAKYDPLTNVYNRASLMSKLNIALEEAKKHEYIIAVILFDVDKFKDINDTYGHCKGDAILKVIANAVKKSIRNTDVFGRLGGDEFLIIQQFIKDKKDVMCLVDRILENIKSQSINLNENEHYINISIGISIFPNDGHSIEELVNCADNAMYYTKKNGGNSYNFYEYSKKVLINSLDKSN
ncbi:MAG: diguanylate cyclase [Clostridium lundense]|nr:diguanylate cyclase [Clostridium lundense]